MYKALLWLCAEPAYIYKTDQSLDYSRNDTEFKRFRSLKPR